MKLNPDCIRDVLMALEGITDGRTSYTFHGFEGFIDYFNLTSYTADEIEYHLRQCDRNGFLVGSQFGCSGEFTIIDISPKAHEFLANIRSDTVYKAVKERLGKIGVFSLKALVDVGKAVATEFITNGLSSGMSPNP